MGVAQEQVKISRVQGERVTGLDISGAFDITIRQGEDTGVTLSIPSHYEDNLVFENWGGTVKVGFKGRIKKHSKNEKFTAEIVCSSLEEVLLSGACKLKGTGDFTAQTVKFDLSGAATAVWDGNFKVVKIGKIDLSGASQLQLNVEVPEVEVETVKQLSAAQDKKLQQNLEKILSKKVVLAYKITPEIIGGLRIKFGSEMIDNSLASKLNRLEIEMKGVQ